MRIFVVLSLTVAYISAGSAQTTQGLISGRILDSGTRVPVNSANVTYESITTNLTGRTVTDASGNYSLPQLSPGLYRIRVTAPKYQAQEIFELQLDVAGRIELNLELRPLDDVWEAGQYRSVFLPGSKQVVTFHGPDVDSSHSTTIEATHGTRGALEATISQVVDPVQLNDLPLAGRDAYTLVALQPGVTADTTTARSLGLSSNGQRPSASNFLLDGIENNNYLVTGPLNAIAPEAIQEYRVSTNNYSAEYGRTSGYIANAITRPGTNVWHGLAYANLENENLNANDFQSNRSGVPRSPLRQIEPGFQTGGPIERGVWFISFSFDYLRSRSRMAPRNYALPTPAFISSTAPNSIARKLLTEFAPPLVTDNGPTGIYRAAPSVSLDRPSGIARVDRLFGGGKHRLMGRMAATEVSRPDFEWTPYKDFISGATESSYSVALSLQSSFTPRSTNGFRFGLVLDNFNLDRAHPEIPILTASPVTLPGSPVFSVFTNRIHTWEALDNFTHAQGRHITTAGGGVLIRGISGVLTAGDNGQYGFASISDFAIDKPSLFRAPLDRQAFPTFILPQFYREYRSNGFFLFAQDTFKLTSRLVLNYGVRYDSFGAPQNTGTVKDVQLELGAGADFATRLANAQLVRPTGRNESVYPADRNDWAPRVGFSYALFRGGKTVVRGSFGTFYDRIFDNTWQNVRNNNFVLPTAFPITASSTNYLAPIASVLPSYQGQPVNIRFPDPLTQSARAPITMFQPGFRTPYIQTYFFGFEQQLSGSWTAESYYMGSVGRKLMTTDSVNRVGTAGPGPILYRANQGTSEYNAFTAVGRYRGRWGDFQISYTLSHTIDNQSDVLTGDYFNLNPVRLTPSSAAGSGISAFTEQFNSSMDRASADFDQRHNLMFFSVVDLPRPQSPSVLSYILRDWKFAQLAALRSGMPYTIFVPVSPATGILNQRAQLIGPPLLYVGEGTPAAGGVRLLNASAFAAPPAGQVGNTGRNAFRAPGFYSFDISLSRSFPVSLLGEAGRVTFRADAFNFLNHANLNAPVATLGSSSFGIARYGRAAPDSGLPVLSPVNDTSRLIQFIFRVQF
jgi:hypothetical protein